MTYRAVDADHRGGQEDAALSGVTSPPVQRGHPPRSRRDAVLAVLGGVTGGAVGAAFGVGGGLVFVPLLALVLRRGQHVAHATSLVAIILPATVAAARYGFAGEVAWPAALVLTGGTLTGVAVGAQLLPRVSEAWLRAGFATLVGLIGLRMLIVGGAAASTGGGSAALSAADAALLAAGGFVAGVESSLLGVSGGIIIVPFLVLLLGYSQHLAEGTSLAVIVPTVLVGAARHARNGYTEWGLGLRLGACAALGAFLGADVALSLREHVLRRAFGALLVVVAALVVVRGRDRKRATP